MPISRGLFWQAAAADKASKGSGDNAAVLEAALLYLEADKCIEAACASVRVAANVQATLEKKQGAPAAGMPDFGLGDFGFAPPAQKTEQRPGTPAFAFDPSQQSLI